MFKCREVVEREKKNAQFSMNMGKEIYSILHLEFIIRGKIGSSYFLSVNGKTLVKLKTGC